MFSEWAIVAIFFISVAGILGAGILGAWVGFRVRTAGTGVPFVQPSTPKADMEKPSSYVSELFKTLDGTDILQEESLSDAARRIREQKIQGPLADVIKEVEGK